MLVIIFDTETNGLPKTKIINPETLNKWPHIVQFSYILFDTDSSQIIKVFDEIVKIPEEQTIDDKCVELHGITKEISIEQGKSIVNVLNEFFQDVSSSDQLIGHNISFDINMLKIELLRLINSTNTESYSHKQQLYSISYKKKIYCTMKNSINLCKIEVPSKNGGVYFKYPKLIDLFKHLFQQEPNHLHNSLNDILVTLRCFYKMVFDTDLLEVNSEFRMLMNEKNLI